MTYLRCFSGAWSSHCPGEANQSFCQRSVSEPCPQPVRPETAWKFLFFLLKPQPGTGQLSPREDLLPRRAAGLSPHPRKQHVRAWQSRGRIQRPVGAEGSGAGSHTCPEPSQGTASAAPRGDPVQRSSCADMPQGCELHQDLPNLPVLILTEAPSLQGCRPACKENTNLCPDRGVASCATGLMPSALAASPRVN